MSNQTEKDILAALRDIALIMNRLFLEIQQVNTSLQAIAGYQKQASSAPPAQQRRP